MFGCPTFRRFTPVLTWCSGYAGGGRRSGSTPSGSASWTRVGTSSSAGRAQSSSGSLRREWLMWKPARFWYSTFPSPSRASMPSRSVWTESWPAGSHSPPDILNRLKVSGERTMTRDEALAMMHEYTASDALRKHMYAVEIAMRAMAEKAGEDPEAWGLVGLLHDFDYERYPNQEHSPTEGHPAEGVRLLAARGIPEAMQRAILGHAPYSGVPRDTPMARALFAVDELAGFLVACALVRPSRSLQDLEVSSVKKKLKDKAFARGVSREDVLQGAAELGVPLDQHIAFVLEALRPHEKRLGLGTP